MYPFPQSITPAVRTHVDAQTEFLNDISKTMFKSFQQMCDLNIRLAQTMMEETAHVGKHLLSADRQTDLLSATTARAQPTSDKLRAYHQHIARLAADAQVEMARVTEQHVQNTTRTARVLADEVARDTTEQTERNVRAQQETIRQFADPFTTHDGDGGTAQAYRGNGEGSQGSGTHGGVGQPHTQSTQGQSGNPSQRSAATH